MYASTKKKDLIGYIDSDFAGSLDDRKSTYGYVFHLGSGAISWASKKHPIVTLPSVEKKICSSNISNMLSSVVKKSF